MSTKSSTGSTDKRLAELSPVRLDLWSVLKYASAFSVFLFLVSLLTSTLLFLALDSLGVLASLADLAGAVLKDDALTQVQNALTLGTTLKVSMVLSVVFSLVFVALLTLLALVHNVVSRLTGGVKILFRQ